MVPGELLPGTRRSGGAATSLLYLVPPVTALLGVPLLGQSVSWSVVAGMVVAGIGVCMVIMRTRKPNPAAADAERAPDTADTTVAPDRSRAVAPAGRFAARRHPATDS